MSMEDGTGFPPTNPPPPPAAAMKDLAATRRLEPAGRRAARPQGSHRPPTILIAGVVHFVDRLQGLAEIERARLRGLLSHAVRDGPAVIVVGTASPPTARSR